MASRQVTLLTHGYLSGRLNFEYPNPYSRLRENFILSELEKELIKDVISKRLVLDAQIMVMNPKAAKMVYTQLDKYSELTLPYFSKASTIKKARENNLLQQNGEESMEYFRRLRSAQKEQEGKLKKDE